MYRTAFPDDMKIDVQRIHSAGDTAIVEFIGKGTHRGELAGIAPTGRKVELPVITVLEMRDGKVHTEREYMDSAYLMQQLGVVAAAATA
jgi:predicted ester cyclase